MLQKKVSSPTRNCNLSTFAAYETIANLKQHKLSQKQSNLLKICLYFSIQTNSLQVRYICYFRKKNCYNNDGYTLQTKN